SSDVLGYVDHGRPDPSPTRRSSDLSQMALFLNADAVWGGSDVPFAVPLLGHAMGSDGVPGVSLQEAGKAVAFYWGGAMVGRAIGDRKSTRLNSSHVKNSYAVFCLKK